MENVTDALYMGFAVLVFVLAISISIGAFTQVTQVSNYIVESKDRETEYTYVEYDSTERIVSGESIVPTLYRASVENYIVRFYHYVGGIKRPYIIYRYKNDKANPPAFEDTNAIDLRTIVVGGQEAQRSFRTFIDNLLNGGLDNLIKTEEGYKNFQTGGDLQQEKFYDILKERTYVETLGVYYEDDLVANQADDINKTAVRVITYTEQP